MLDVMYKTKQMVTYDYRHKWRTEIQLFFTWKKHQLIAIFALRLGLIQCHAHSNTYQTKYKVNETANIVQGEYKHALKGLSNLSNMCISLKSEK